MQALFLFYSLPSTKIDLSVNIQKRPSETDWFQTAFSLSTLLPNYNKVNKQDLFFIQNLTDNLAHVFGQTFLCIDAL